MKLKFEIIRKYNVLLLEALQFYHCGDYTTPDSLDLLQMIISHKLGYDPNITSFNCFTDFLKVRYPYLEPFERFYVLHQKNELQYNREVFKEINVAIQIIRNIGG